MWVTTTSESACTFTVALREESVDRNCLDEFASFGKLQVALLTESVDRNKNVA